MQNNWAVCTFSSKCSIEAFAGIRRDKKKKAVIRAPKHTLETALQVYSRICQLVASTDAQSTTVSALADSPDAVVTTVVTVVTPSSWGAILKVRSFGPS